MHTYNDYLKYSRKIWLLNGATNILESYDGLLSVPENGNNIRGEQVAAIKEIVHNLLTDRWYHELLLWLSNVEFLSWDEKKNIQLSLQKVTEAKVIDSEFVKLLSQEQTASVDAYYKARESGDFSFFAPFLEKVVIRMREYARHRKGFATPYDALLDKYDRWLTTQYLEDFFWQIKEKLLPIVRLLQKQNSNQQPIIIDKVRLENLDVIEFFRERLREIGFDLTRGTITSAPASFMLDGNPDDTRICYRNTGLIMEMIGSIFHEGWHGLYEQAFSVDDMGLPKWEAASYSMHESQSRLYENHVGYSEEYLHYLLPKLQTTFPEEFKDMTVSKLFEKIHVVTKAPRRLDADEISYHIHILIRYEIERDLINWVIEVEDLPRIWNAKYKEYLDIDVQDDIEWVLQDIHWADGSFGYFPTYSLGTMYATQLFHSLGNEIPNLHKKIESGNLLDIKSWLNTHIHSQGRLMTSSEIMEQSTWKMIDVDGYVLYIRSKYWKIYSIPNL